MNLSIRLCLFPSLLTFALPLAADAIDYPEQYRQWSHIKTLTLHQGHALENPFKGIHHVYGNTEGVQGVKSGQFKDGAILVFDLLESVTKDNASAEGQRVLLGVMVKDNSKFTATGGWGFEGWAGDSRTERLVKDGGKSCFDCHASQQSTDYVFSRWRN